MRSIGLILFLGSVLLGCDDVDGPVPTLRAPSDPAPVVAPDSVDVSGLGSIVATLDPVGGSGIEGTVRLVRLGDAVRVLATLRGVRTDQHYAFQVLLGRDCDADPDVHLGAELGRPHGSPYAPAAQRHLGDLGSIRGDDSGRGRYDRLESVLSLDGTSSAAGRAVVVRAQRDDLATQPAGRAGDVVACGVLSGGRS